MFELTTADVLSLQVDEVAGLKRKSSRHGAKKLSICLVTLSNVLNDANILNIFGGGDGFSL
ncbi:MAG TPA: hypothetical protein VJS45_08745 [Acidimicrobiia bacterium]|nr:hypothetical protein [Acidimicrobiia bacterium]